jgi:hypothetical protein
LADCPGVAVKAIVPEAVIGEPPTVSHGGAVTATDVTVPEPAGVDHVPSPRKNVVDDGEPDAGRSAMTMARNPTAPGAPLGVATNWLAVCAPVAVIASVPDTVTGEPPTVSHDGVVRATDTTVPEPAGVDHVPSPRKKVVPEGVPDAGRSPIAMTRNATAPVPPVGVARKDFAACPAVAVTASVPVVVTGEPATVSHVGVVRATDTTVPPPAADHVPSPRRKVVDDGVPVAGMSAMTRARHVGTAFPPEVGPAWKACATCGSQTT